MSRSALVALVVALSGGLASAQPVEPDPRVELEREREELRRRLAATADVLGALSARVAELEASRRAEADKTAREVSELRDELRRQPLVRAGRFGLTLTGLTQVDAVAWRQSSLDEVDPSTGAPLNETRFLLRRARLRAELDYRFVFGSFEIDANTVRGPQVRPISFDAGVRYWNRKLDVPYVAFHLGLVRTPFGFEVQQSDRDRLFLERSTVMGAFFPGEYDLGARLYGGWRFLRYAIAAMNGDPIGEKAFPAVDPNQSKDIVVRGGVDLSFGRIGLRGGFSAVYGQGFHKGVAAGKDTLVWRDQNQNGQIDPGELLAIPGQAFQPSANFDRHALGGDLQLSVRLPKVGALCLLGELVYGVNMDRGVQLADPVASARDLRELGWYVGVTQELTPYAQVGLRYDVYDPDRDSTDLQSGKTVPRDQRYTHLVATAAARWPRYGRLILEYNHGTNSLGRRPDGVSTSLADDSFTVRAEVTF